LSFVHTATNCTHGSVGDIRDTNDLSENSIPYMSFNSYSQSQSQLG